MTAGRRWLVSGVVVMVAAGGVVAAEAAGVFHGPAASATEQTSYHTGIATVTRRSLTSQTELNATLGTAGDYSVVNQSTGTITSLPVLGQVVHQGQTLYGINGNPVVLLYGSVPAWRALSEGMTGSDVTEINHALVALGYANGADVSALGWDYFGWDTAYALEEFQTHLGLTVTGTLPLGQAVFLPSAALITGQGTNTALGVNATPGSVVLMASSTTPEVTIDLDPAQQSEVKDGDPVTITLPDGATTPGVVSSVGKIAASPSSSGSGSSSSGSSGSGSSSGSSATIAVEVSLTHPSATASLSQAPVTVTIDTGSVSDALVVPVNALLAEPGGYVVEVIGAGGRHRPVSVTTGLFDDASGLVQVSGAALAAGQHVVVPGS